VITVSDLLTENELKFSS